MLRLGQLYRSQARLQKIGDQLSSHTLKDNANEDDPSININSDGELNDDGKVSPRDIDSLSNLLSFKKRQPEYPAANKVKTGNSLIYFVAERVVACLKIFDVTMLLNINLCCCVPLCSFSFHEQILFLLINVGNYSLHVHFIFFFEYSFISSI